MSGRRLLDAAKLFNASKSIAKQHVNLRAHQLDVYSKTSTLMKAAKNQTDRFTLTAQAAIALSRRFNEPSSSYTASSGSAAADTREHSLHRKETVSEKKEDTTVKEGFDQDHHYSRSRKHASAAPVVDRELPVRQEDAPRHPLPDGTIPTSATALYGQEQDQDTFSKRPIPEPPKEPLTKDDAKEAESIKPAASTSSRMPLPDNNYRLTPDGARKLQRQFESQIPSVSDEITQSARDSPVEKLYRGHDRDIFYTRSAETKQEPSSLPRTKIPKYTEDVQESDYHVRDEKINQEVFYSTPRPGQPGLKREEVPPKVDFSEQGQLPEGVNTDVFRTKRVAKMLGGNLHDSRPPPGLDIAGKELLDGTGAAKAQSKSPVTESPTQSKSTAEEKEMHDFASDLMHDMTAAPSPVSEISEKMVTEPTKAAYELRESKVPSSRFGRLWQYAGLGTSMALGAVGEGLRRATGSAASGTSLMLSAGNMELLVSKLSRMRGAALKLGQMISFQDSKMLPPQIQEVIQRVQDSADYMPASQRDKVLTKNLGPNWRNLFQNFDEVPIAAASIGQVHKAVLRDGRPVAVKVQYPGVADSIDSDLKNLSILLTASRLLPKGLFLDKTIDNARLELGWECDYVREAEAQVRFRELLADDANVFDVPEIIPEACGPQVLTADLMAGIGVAKLPLLAQEKRDWIGKQILRLCLREIVEFKFMQTDPNWTNFLYNEELNKIELLDFGASRDYPNEFIDPYVNVLIAASQNNKPAIRDLSLQLGYLTGAESQTMLDAHIESVLTLAEPFKADGPDLYDFDNQTITERVRSLIPVMVKERLSPPPEETYSLHRKLSGAFLLCARLGSRVPCRELFERAVRTYRSGGKEKLLDS